MGWFFKWRRTPSQEARSQALIIKLFSCVPYGTRNESSSSSESNSDEDIPFYEEIVQQNINYAKVCTSQQKKLEKLKDKLDSSQEAYKTLLEQYENFANLNVELSTKIE